MTASQAASTFEAHILHKHLVKLAKGACEGLDYVEHRRGLPDGHRQGVPREQL